MSTGMVALLVAAVGVAGTLLAPLTTAWVGARSRLQEFELQQRVEAARRQEEALAADLERRRQAYLALNSSARLWRILLMEDVRALRAGGSGHAQATEEARSAFHGDFAQAQMLVPDDVLDAATRVRIALADARKRLDLLGEGGAGGAGVGAGASGGSGGSGGSEEAWEELYDRVMRIWDVITTMQAAMRKDLGVGSGVPVPAERPEQYRQREREYREGEREYREGEREYREGEREYREGGAGHGAPVTPTP
ncbi:hypothetical protein [Streptomyces sp. NPDC050504]|uniref:hypothetical protein n=1 Tax=Streptomyces sp. NPDC050504 TaxID=3365618 RepID=UPI0037AC79CA